jgi:hypothetical protein
MVGSAPLGATTRGSPQALTGLSLEEFKAKVLARQIRNALRKGRSYCSNVPDSELATVEGEHRMRKAAAVKCKELLVAAREALEADKQQGDGLAKKTREIGVYSAYRNIPEDTAAWESSFAQYYLETRDTRAAFPTGEHGSQAQALMASMMISYKAAPGYSNHSNGMAVDFYTIFSGKKLRAKKKQRTAWTHTWLYKWLIAHGGEYDFVQLSTEEWHWDYTPKKAEAS